MQLDNLCGQVTLPIALSACIESLASVTPAALPEHP
jgi:hypothetical protein